MNVSTPDRNHPAHARVCDGDKKGVGEMDDIFQEMLEEIAEESADEVGSDAIKDIVEGLFD